MAFLLEYGLFLAKTLTILIAIVIVIVVALSGSKQKPKQGTIEVEDISEKNKEIEAQFAEQTLDKKALKAYRKAQKKACEETSDKPKAFYISFKGSIDANEVSALREEVTTIITLANPEKDSVFLNLESAGGVVHGYGLAASQLNRLREHNIPLTICVDKVAASGGYMMACVANKIIAAPFAIVGSIGVISQIPNFNKLLKKHDVEFEQVTAGQYKRTLTMFGENTNDAREKFQLELDETHGLFKHFILKYRPDLDIDKVSTGEHWFAEQAISLGLVDKLSTSDDELLNLKSSHQLFKVTYTQKKALSDKLGVGFANLLSRSGISILSKSKSL